MKQEKGEGIKKNLYRIPIQISTYDVFLRKTIIIEYKVKVSLAKGQSFRVLIGSAISRAKKEFWKEYPAHIIKDIKTDIQKREFVCKIRTKARKPRERKLPFPIPKFAKKPEESKMRILEILGRDALKREYVEVEYKRQTVLIILLDDEKISFLQNRLMIINQKILRYVKIMGEDMDGNPVLIRWDSSSFTTRHPRPYVEHLWDGDFRDDLSSCEYKISFMLAKRILKL